MFDVSVVIDVEHLTAVFLRHLMRPHREGMQYQFEVALDLGWVIMNEVNKKRDMVIEEYSGSMSLVLTVQEVLMLVGLRKLREPEVWMLEVDRIERGYAMRCLMVVEWCRMDGRLQVMVR